MNTNERNPYESPAAWAEPVESTRKRERRPWFPFISFALMCMGLYLVGVNLWDHAFDGVAIGTAIAIPAGMIFWYRSAFWLTWVYRP